MLADGILVSEQFATQQPKWSGEFQHFTMAFTEQDKQSESADPIDQPVKSSPAHIWLSQPYSSNFSYSKQVPKLIVKVPEDSDWDSIMLRQQYLKQFD